MSHREKFSKKFDLAFSSRIEHEREWGQKEKTKKMPQNEEGFEMEWIYV